MITRNPWFRSFLGMVVLAIYIWSFVDRVHVHVHHHAHDHHALHDGDCAKDACHVSIYHLNGEGCNHKAHYIPAEEPCYQCQEIAQIQFFLDKKELEFSADLNEQTLFSLDQLCERRTAQFRKVRGPPSFLS